MTILSFPTQTHFVRVVSRGEIESLAALLGGYIIWPDEPRGVLTPREVDTLALLGRKPRSTQAVAVDLYLNANSAYRLLAALAHKGYAQRVGKHVGGGWVAVPMSQSAPISIAA